MADDRESDIRRSRKSTDDKDEEPVKEGKDKKKKKWKRKSRKQVVDDDEGIDNESAGGDDESVGWSETMVTEETTLKDAKSSTSRYEPLVVSKPPPGKLDETGSDEAVKLIKKASKESNTNATPDRRKSSTINTINQTQPEGDDEVDTSSESEKPKEPKKPQPVGTTVYQIEVRFIVHKCVRLCGGVRVILNCQEERAYVQLITLMNEVFATYELRTIHFLESRSAAGVCFCAVPWSASRDKNKDEDQQETENPEDDTKNSETGSGSQDDPEAAEYEKQRRQRCKDRKPFDIRINHVEIVFCVPEQMIRFKTVVETVLCAIQCQNNDESDDDSIAAKVPTQLYPDSAFEQMTCFQKPQIVCGPAYSCVECCTYPDGQGKDGENTEAQRQILCWPQQPTGSCPQHQQQQQTVLSLQQSQTAFPPQPSPFQQPRRESMQPSRQSVQSSRQSVQPDQSAPQPPPSQQPPNALFLQPPIPGQCPQQPAQPKRCPQPPILRPLPNCYKPQQPTRCSPKPPNCFGQSLPPGQLFYPLSSPQAGLCQDPTLPQQLFSQLPTVNRQSECSQASPVGQQSGFSCDKAPYIPEISSPGHTSPSVQAKGCLPSKENVWAESCIGSTSSVLKKCILSRPFDPCPGGPDITCLPCDLGDPYELNPGDGRVIFCTPACLRVSFLTCPNTIYKGKLKIVEGAGGIGFKVRIENAEGQCLYSHSLRRDLELYDTSEVEFGFCYNTVVCQNGRTTLETFVVAFPSAYQKDQFKHAVDTCNEIMGMTSVHGLIKNNFC